MYFQKNGGQFRDIKGGGGTYRDGLMRVSETGKGWNLFFRNFSSRFFVFYKTTPHLRGSENRIIQRFANRG